MANLLIVDSDALHLEFLSSSILKKCPQHNIWTGGGRDEALSVLHHIKIDLIVTGLPMEGMEGLSLLLRVAKDRPPIPVVVITLVLPDFEPANALGATTFLSRPVSEDNLVATINRLLPLHALHPQHGLTVPGILQMVANQHTDCVLTLLSANAKGRLTFQAGNLVHAETQGIEGEEAVFTMMPWVPHHFHTTPLKGQARRTITESLTSILMDASVRMDESSHNK